MPELRTALEKALRQAMIGNVHVICDRLEQVDIEFAAIASELAASAMLRPHLGPGVTLTAEEIGHITSMLDWYFTDAQRRARPEQLAAIDSFKRWAQASAIAGRGEEQ